MDLLFIYPLDNSDDDWVSSPIPDNKIPEFKDFPFLHSENLFKVTRAIESKVVRFNENVEFIPLNEPWDEEQYSLARKSNWQSIYLDRLRFQNRISEVDSLIGDIFVQSHRKYLMMNELIFKYKGLFHSPSIHLLKNVDEVTQACQSAASIAQSQSKDTTTYVEKALRW